jgi:hypothetical protein
MTKQIGSVTTGLPKVSLKQTGEQRGVIGYGDLSSLPLPNEDKRPTELQTIIDDSARRLINLAFTKHAEGLIQDVRAGHLSLDLIEKGERELTLALSAAQQALPPVTKEKIADALHSFAEMLQCTVPTPEGLKLYFYALQDMPYYKFQAACMALVKRHKWPRLPLPADFIEASKDARNDIDSFMANIQYAKQVFQLAAMSRRMPR